MLSGQMSRIYFARMLEDEDLLDGIKTKVEESRVNAGAFIAIGTVKNVVLGFYENGQYKYIRKDEPLEIASCVGNIAVNEQNEVIVHAHITVSDAKGAAFGGHLMKGSRVGATAELMLIETTSVALIRTLDPKTNLNLLKLG